MRSAHSQCLLGQKEASDAARGLGMNWVICPRSWDETFQECNMGKDIPGPSAGN